MRKQGQKLDKMQEEKIGKRKEIEIEVCRAAIPNGHLVCCVHAHYESKSDFGYGVFEDAKF